MKRFAVISVLSLMIGLIGLSGPGLAGMPNWPSELQGPPLPGTAEEWLMLREYHIYGCIMDDAKEKCVGFY